MSWAPLLLCCENLHCSAQKLKGYGSSHASMKVFFFFLNKAKRAKHTAKQNCQSSHTHLGDPKPRSSRTDQFRLHLNLRLLWHRTVSELLRCCRDGLFLCLALLQVIEYYLMSLTYSTGQQGSNSRSNEQLITHTYKWEDFKEHEAGIWHIRDQGLNQVGWESASWLSVSILLGL